jgi:hypothetical protein
MAIYKGGQSQFNLHEAANKEEPSINDADYNGEVIAKEKDWSNIHFLDRMHKEHGEETPIGGTGIAKGLRKKNEK